MSLYVSPKKCYHYNGWRAIKKWSHSFLNKIVVQGKRLTKCGGSFVFMGVNMAEKKTTKKTTKKVTYRDKKFTVMEEVNGRLKLTDDVIHFWVKADKVERN